MKVSVFFVYILRTAKELNITIEESIKLVKEIGYDMVEFDIAEFDVYPDAYSLCKQNGFSVSNVYGECESEQEVYRLIDKAVECNSPCAMVLPRAKFSANGDIKSQMDNSDYVQNFSNVLKNGVAYAQKVGVNLTLECYGSGNIASKTEYLAYLFSVVDGLMHTYDSGNFYLNGEDGLSALDRFKDITVHVHLKDYLLSPSLSDCDFSISKIATAVGSGESGIDKILDKLHSIGYNSAFTVEYLGVEKTYFAIKKSIEYLRGKR